MYKEILKNRKFALLTIGGFVSNIGDYLYNIGVTVYLYSITKSVGAVALMWLSRGVLRIPVQYLAGIVADRFNKKAVIVYTNLISVPIAFLLVFASENRLWMVYVLAFLLQSLNDMDMSSETAILPELVSKEQLPYSNSVFSFLESVSVFLSPAIGGIIYKIHGSNVLFIINAASFLIAGILFSFIKYDHVKAEETRTKFGLIESGVEGYKVLASYTEVKTVFIMMSVYALMGRFYETYKVAVSDVLLKMKPEGIIYFDYALAIGGLLAPFLIKPLSKYKQVHAFAITSLIVSVGYLFFGYSNHFATTFTALIVLGLTQSIQGIYCRTMIQKNIPVEYVGRVFSFYKMLLTLFAILGLVIATPMYESMGIGNAFLIVAILSFMICGKQLVKATFKTGNHECVGK